MDEFVGICSSCLASIVKPTDTLAVGYGKNDNGEKVCYPCCAERDKEYMREHGKITLYLDDKVDTVSNWPGSLRIKVIDRKIGKHNWNVERTDVWFQFEGNMWWGVHYGSSHQLINCRRLKNSR